VLRALWVLAAALAMTPVVSAEIFKCTAKNGLALYQNFPCSMDSQGWLPSDRPTVKPATRSVQPEGVKPAPAIVAATEKAARVSEPRIGMSQEEVRALWGPPQETDQDERKEGRIEIWRYVDGRSIEFNHKQRVSAVPR
jgi:hypothetical protein